MEIFMEITILAGFPLLVGLSSIIILGLFPSNDSLKSFQKLQKNHKAQNNKGDFFKNRKTTIKNKKIKH